MPVLLGLYVFLASDYGELPDDPTVSVGLVAFLYFGALVMWPFFLHGLVFQQAPHGIVWLAMFVVTALFWGFIVELLFMVKTRLWPNQSPEPTAVGAGCHRATGSAVAVHAASRRWLSFFY